VPFYGQNAGASVIITHASVPSLVSTSATDTSCAHLDMLGIGWTGPDAAQIAIARRADVAKLDLFVGPKR
jgi:hypothetical protein